MDNQPFLPPTQTGNPRRMPPPKLDPDTGCWIWQGSTVSGYGKLSYRGQGPEWVHRVYYEIAKGPIPPGEQVHHTCENRACCNPAHLEVLSARAHGRLGPSAKLTVEQVREIRARSLSGCGPRELAREFGISEQHLCAIKAGRIWQENVTCPNCSHTFDPYE